MFLLFTCLTTWINYSFYSGKTAAALMGEIPLQQSILAATRTVTVTSRNLLMAAKNVCALPDSEYSAEVLKQTIEEFGKNVEQLLTDAQNASAEATKGDKKLNATKADILRLLDRFQEADNIGT